MTRNVERDKLCTFTEQLIDDFEKSRDQETTDLGQQFAQLHRMMMQKKECCLSLEGAKPINIRKNRYKDVLPYDEHRVILETVNNSDYINASFVEDLNGNRRYVAAQGPISETVEDFFRMIWELQICSIICTANDIEAGRLKFHRYWPDKDETLSFGCFNISLNENDDRSFFGEHFHVRSLIIHQGTNSRRVLLYHFLHWQDHDVPNNERSIIDLLNRLDNDRSCSPNTPILVHCSAGCGRTGSLIAIDLCRLMLRNDDDFHEKFQLHPIYQIALHIRQYRIALIQTVRQYVFVHKVLVYLLKSNGENALIYEENKSTGKESSENPLSNRSLTNFVINAARRPSGPFIMKLENPPIGRRTQIHQKNSQTGPDLSSTGKKFVKNDFDDSTPPPIPPRTFLNNSTNKPSTVKDFRIVEPPVKLKTNLRRSRPVQRQTAKQSKSEQEKETARADSADPFSSSTEDFRERRKAILFESGVNSD